MTLMNMKEACAYTGFSRYALLEWVKSGNLIRTKHDGVYVYQQEDLDEALELHDPRGSNCFVDDYNHLRDFGLSNEQVAARLGIETELMVARAKRLGVYRPSLYERQAQAVLDRLIDSGDPFSAEVLPCLFDPGLPSVLLSRASAERRVRVAGKRKASLSRTGTRVNVYEGVAA